MRPLVLVAVDGFADTERTVTYAVTLAHSRAADLHAVQVVPRGGARWTALEHEARLRARLAALRPLAERVGVSYEVVTLFGTPDGAIAAYAQRTSASLVVVGRHYATSRVWRSTAVTGRLSRLSPVPVLVVPRGAEIPGHASPRRVVAAVDFTAASAVALRTAVDLTKRHGAHLTMLHAAGAPLDMEFSGIEVLRRLDQRDADARRAATRLKRTALALGAVDAEPVVVTADAHRGIVDAAEAAGADLIVMGVAPRTRLEQVVSGSTLRSVLKRARTPVLVVPAPAGAHAGLTRAEREHASATPSVARVGRAA